jgi:hypothetical protein
MIWAGCAACGTPTKIKRRRINAPVVRICFRWQCEFGANDLGAFTGGELHMLHATSHQTRKTSLVGEVRRVMVEEESKGK